MSIRNVGLKQKLAHLVPSLALLVACQSGLWAEEADGGETPAPPPVVETDPTPTPAVDPDKRLDDLAAQLDRLKDGKSAVAKYHYDKGIEAYAENRLTDAIEHLRIAVDADRGNAEYLKKLREVGAAANVIADPRDVIADTIADTISVEHQRLLIEIEQRIEEGNTHLMRKEYSQALKSFNMAKVRLQNLPIADLNREPKLRQVEGLIEETQKRSHEADLDNAAEANALAQDRQRELREHNIRIEMSRINAMLARAQKSRARRNYDEAILYCQQVLKINPSEARAHDLMVRARRERHVFLRQLTADLWDEEHLRLHEEIQEDMLPQLELVRYSDDWAEIDARRSAPSRTGLDNVDVAWRQEVMNKLEEPITVNFQENDIMDVVQFLQAQTDVNIILDPEVVAELDVPPITMEMSNVKLGSALEFIMTLTELRYSLQDEAVYISSEDGLRGDATMVIYDIRDLINPLTMFPGPRMTIPQPGSDDGNLVTEIEGESDEEVGDFIELISEVVSPESWDQDGISIDEYNGNMVVTQTPDVHSEIDELLRTLRNQRGVQISVQVKWLDVTDSMLELITFEWDDYSSLTVTPQNLGTPSRPLPLGFYSNNDRSSGVATINNDGIGNYFENTGFGNPQGFGFDGQLNVFIDQDPEGLIASLLVNAVEQSDRANIAIEPRITLFNGQRSHLVQLVQQSYVSDYDVVGDQYDPVISVLAFGTVLDVEAIASADRKYITLTLQPTNAILEQFREFNLTSDVLFGAANAGGNANVPGNIPAGLNYPLTAPEVSYRSVQTSVTIPDGGTMLVAGLTNASSQRSHQGVPFLSHIPFLGRLFSGNGRSEVETKTIISVKGDIILFDEIEKEL